MLRLRNRHLAAVTRLIFDAVDTNRNDVDWDGFMTTETHRSDFDSGRR